MRIRAAVLRHPGEPVAVEEVELDPPKANEVLVRVAAVGVCHSDVRHADGDLGPRWPAVMGHEGAGVVEAVGAGRHARRARRPRRPLLRSRLPRVPVLRAQASRTSARSSPSTALAGCSWTERAGSASPTARCSSTACGRRASRSARVVAAGGAVPIPRELPLWQAALLGCGVVTGVGAVSNVAKVEPGDSVAVLGCGGVGLQVIAAARRAGADPIVASTACPEKLELARAHGATHVVDTAATTARRAPIHALTDGGVDYAFEVVGRPETIRLAWDAIRPGGTAVVVGLAPEGVEASVPAIEFLSDKSLVGTYYGSGDPAAELPALAELALSGDLDLAGVVTHVDDLDGVQAALDRLRRGEGARTVLVVDAALAGHR